MAPEPNPRLLFERLFGAGNHGERLASLRRRQQEQRSILDFVMDDAHALEKQLTYRDKQKLDEYLVSVREIEQRIQRAERFGKPADPNLPTPDGIPNGFEEYRPGHVRHDGSVVSNRLDEDCDFPARQ